MKIRFSAALLTAALSLSLLTGCAAVTAVPAPAQPTLAVIEEPTLPLAPAPTAAAPAPTEVSSLPTPTEAPTAPAQSQRITREEAIAIALADAGFTEDQVSRLWAELDLDGRRPEYDVDFHQGGFEYDYEIHAETGQILTREKERDD